MSEETQTSDSLICEDCEDKILEKEHYVKVISFIDGKEETISYFHVSCYNKPSKKMAMKKANRLLNSAYGIMGKIDKMIKNADAPNKTLPRENKDTETSI